MFSNTVVAEGIQLVACSEMHCSMAQEWQVRVQHEV